MNTVNFRRHGLIGQAVRVVIGIASLLSIAANCPGGPAVIHVTASNGTLFADYLGERGQQVFQSADGGSNWRPTQLAISIGNAFAEPVSPTKQACDPEDPAICYRLTNAPRIEQSRDGGQTWTTTWEFSNAREAFMTRLARQGAFSGCPDGEAVVTTPVDLAVYHWNDSTVAVAAMGNDGVLVRVGEDAWERRGIAAATPLAEASSGWQEVLWVTLPELGNWFIAALLMYLVFTAWPSWRYARAQERPGEQRVALALNGACGLLWLVWALVVFASVDAALMGTHWPDYLLVIVAWPSYFLIWVARLFLNPLVNFPILLAGLLILIVALVKLQRFVRAARYNASHEPVRRTRGLRWLLALLVFPVAYAPFVLWGMGLLGPYWLALLLAVGVILATAALGVWRLWPKAA
jgi:hypothetical protein